MPSAVITSAGVQTAPSQRLPGKPVAQDQLGTLLACAARLMGVPSADCLKVGLLIGPLAAIGLRWLFKQQYEGFLEKG